MIKSKDFFLSPSDIGNITTLIDHLSSVIKLGVQHGPQHDLWASYYRMAHSSFRRMCSCIESSCDVEEDKYV